MAGERTIELECKENLAFLMMEGGRPFAKTASTANIGCENGGVHKHIGCDSHAL
jgi:hypothetical protein